MDTDDRMSAKRGQQVATALSAAVRTAGYYDPGNTVMVQAGGELLASLREASADSGSVSFSVHSHCVFVNKVRIPTSVSTYGRFASLMQLFDEWRINTLTIDQGISEGELQEMLMLLSRSRPGETEYLGDLLRDRGLSKVRAENIEPGTGRESRPITPVLAYSAAMHLGLQLNESSGVISSEHRPPRPSRDPVCGGRDPA